MRIDDALNAKEFKKRVELKLCAECGKHEDYLDALKTFQRCEATFYCSRKCQKRDWKNHKKVCAK